jgi:glycine dehydrogenase
LPFHHGPKGLQYIADSTAWLLPSHVTNKQRLPNKYSVFDTIVVKADAKKVREIAEKLKSIFSILMRT